MIPAHAEKNWALAKTEKQLSSQQIKRKSYIQKCPKSIVNSLWQIFCRRKQFSSLLSLTSKNSFAFICEICGKENFLFLKMFKRLKEFYQQYKEYVRVDLVMYGVMIVLIIFYFIYSVLFWEKSENQPLFVNFFTLHPKLNWLHWLIWKKNHPYI